MATYINPTGPVITSQTSLNVFTNFTSPLQLVWPLQLYPTNDIVCTTMNFSTSNMDSQVYLPQANQAGVGNSFIMVNKGTTDINISNFGGEDALFVLEDGTSRLVYLVNNSTEVGVWNNIVLGATMSPADVAVLAGYGLIALPENMPTNLNTEFTVSSISTSIALDATSRASLFLLTTSGLSITLPTLVPAIPNGFFSIIYNASDNLNTLICPSGITINGSSLGLNLAPTQSCFLIFDGISNYTTVGLETVTAKPITLTNINISGLEYYDLTQSDLDNNIIVFSGIPLTDCKIYFGNATNDIWTIHNNIDNSFSLIPYLGTNVSPGAPAGAIGPLCAVQIFSNQDNESIDIVSPVYPTNIAPRNYTPFNSGLSSSSGSSYPTYGGMILDFTTYTYTTAIIDLLITPQTVLSDSIACSLPDNGKTIIISGNISISPSTTDGTDATLLYLEKSIDNSTWTRTVTSMGNSYITCLIGSTNSNSSLLNISFTAYDEFTSLSLGEIIYYRVIAIVEKVSGTSVNGKINSNSGSPVVTGSSTMGLTILP